MHILMLLSTLAGIQSEIEILEVGRQFVGDYVSYVS